MKTKLPFLALLAAAFAFADEPLPASWSAVASAKAEGSAKEGAKKPDACCEALPAVLSAVASAKAEGLAKEGAKFSSESIYQLDGQFVTDSGQPFPLGELRGRPVVLNMFFASCGYACPLQVTDMLAIQGRLPAELRGKAVFLLVSFDIARDTPAALAKYRASRSLDSQWVLLHGDDSAVRELAALVGVKYKQESDGMFAHSNLITVLNAEGEVVHQRAGLKGGLDEAAAALASVLRK